MSLLGSAIVQRAVGVCGVEVVWQVDAGLPDPLTPLLAAQPAAPGGAARVELALRAGLGEAPPAGARPSFFHGAIRGFEHGGRFWLVDGSSGVVVTPASGEILASIAPGSGESSDAPLAVMLFIALAIALRARGLFHVHAGGVLDRRGRVVLLAGGAGSGKTTSTLALAEAGWPLLSDDVMLLGRFGGRAGLRGFLKELHLGPETAAAFPRLPPLAHGRTTAGKLCVDPRRAYPLAVAPVAGAPLAALVFPEVVREGRTRIEPLPAEEVFGLLLQSSALGVVDGMPALPEQLELLGALAGEVPAVRACLGRDLLGRPAVLAELLHEPLGLAL